MRHVLLSGAAVGCLVLHACTGTRESGSRANPGLTPRTDGVVDASSLGAVSEERPAAVDASAGVEADATHDSGAAAPGAATDAPPVELEPEPPPEKLRYRPVGACVDPLTDATQRLRPGRTHRKQTGAFDALRVAIRRDLDGDEQDDQVLVGQLALGGDAHFVYVMRGTCGHFAGRIDTRARLEVVGGYIKGLRALGGFFPCLPMCCVRLMYDEYRYDGARYKRAVAEVRKRGDCPAQL